MQISPKIKQNSKCIPLSQKKSWGKTLDTQSSIHNDRNDRIERLRNKIVDKDQLLKSNFRGIKNYERGNFNLCNHIDISIEGEKNCHGVGRNGVQKHYKNCYSNNNSIQKQKPNNNNGCYTINLTQKSSTLQKKENRVFTNRNSCINKPYYFQYQSIQYLIISMLWLDLQLSKIVNVFPPQLKQLEQSIPTESLRNLRPILKLINTIIPSSDYQQKNENENPRWRQYSICMLERSYFTWETRWDLQSYGELVRKGNSIEMSITIDHTLKKMGIDENMVMCRGLMIRYLMDVNH